MIKPALEDPVTLSCGHMLGNRIAKAAMSEQLADACGDVTPDLISLYGQWAQGGAGLLITGNAAVDRSHPVEPFNVVVDEQSDRTGLAAWAEAAKGGGSAVWLQLNHPGRQVLRTVAPRALTPSLVPRQPFEMGYARPVELTTADIERIIDAFTRAAVIAEGAGFDGVEVHAAHGYLASQFLSPRINRRTDAWGGRIENRMRFLTQVVESVRASVGASFAVGVKLNASDLEPDGFAVGDAAKVIASLAERGVDLIELTAGTARAWLDVFAGQYDGNDGYFAGVARQLPRALGVPIMLTGGIRSVAAMERLVGDGIDVIGLARPFAVDPHAGTRALGGGDLDGPRHPRTWPKALGAALHSPWYQQQLRRIAGGEPIDPGLGRVATARAHARTVMAWRSARRHAIPQDSSGSRSFRRTR